ncbi:MAG TPA: hypothetical protein VM144_03865, partial [Aestuariivirga sp.]|nr:hypothetical protein [Aestuariivirga sp.]
AWATVNSPQHLCVDHDMLETLFINHLELLRNTLTEELETREPKSAHELEVRNECLCTWQMMCGSFPDAAKLLVDLVANERDLPKHIE